MCGPPAVQGPRLAIIAPAQIGAACRLQLIACLLDRETELVIPLVASPLALHTVTFAPFAPVLPSPSLTQQLRVRQLTCQSLSFAECGTPAGADHRERIRVILTPLQISCALRS